MRIIADKREKNSLVIAELKELRINVELRQLKVADYIIGEIAIERKTISDFISSMINKRLIKQLEELRQYKKRLLIIEGIDEKEFYSDKQEGINANAIRGMLLSIVLDFEVPIIFTKNSEDTAKFLMLISKRQKKKREISLRAKKKSFSVSEQQQFILEGFPGIGPALAKALLKKFKTIRKIINANLSELKKIKKLGEKKARILKEIVESKYRD